MSKVLTVDRLDDALRQKCVSLTNSRRYHGLKLTCAKCGKRCQYHISKTFQISITHHYTVKTIPAFWNHYDEWDKFLNIRWCPKCPVFISRRLLEELTCHMFYKACIPHLDTMILVGFSELCDQPYHDVKSSYLDFDSLIIKPLTKQQLDMSQHPWPQDMMAVSSGVSECTTVITWTDTINQIHHDAYDLFEIEDQQALMQFVLEQIIHPVKCNHVHCFPTRDNPYQVKNAYFEKVLQCHFIKDISQMIMHYAVPTRALDLAVLGGKWSRK